MTSNNIAGKKILIMVKLLIQVLENHVNGAINTILVAGTITRKDLNNFSQIFVTFFTVDLFSTFYVGKDIGKAPIF